MSDMGGPDLTVLAHERLTLDELFGELAGRDVDAVAARAATLPTDVMLDEGAGSLIDAAAYLRVVARDHALPGGPAALRLQELSEELTAQAAGWQRAADNAAISIRATVKRGGTGA